ncbi:MAG TPA: amidase domain-containing protein [Tepidisphaeraceae bacterium]|nr:amidase domain-containing protein [Tepidisphaeraceae bacterium]
MRKYRHPQLLIDPLERRMLLSVTGIYNRTAAVAYANQYAYEVVSDGYFWINGSSYNSYTPGSSVPRTTGDDCAHFVSSCIRTPPGGTGGGLPIPSRVPPTYGEPGAASLDELLISDGYAKQVSSVSQLQPGDVIGYDWDGSGSGSMNGIDHTVVYLGNGKIAAHSNSNDGAAWNSGNSSSTITFFIHITLPSSAPNVPTNVSPTDSTTVLITTPTLTASAFSDSSTGISQKAAQWHMYLGNTVVYSSGVDTTDLTSVTVPAGILTNGSTYAWSVRYEDNYGNWSSYSIPTTFTVQTPTVLALSGPSLYVRVDPDAQHVDVWNNADATGNPSQQVPLSQITTITIDGPSNGSNVVLDFSNGSPTPSGQITIQDSGNASNNLLNVIGTTTGNDSITATNGQLNINGNAIAYSDVTTAQFTPGAGTDSLAVSGGSLLLGGSSASLSSLSISPGATLDLGMTVVSVAYSAPNDPAATLQSQVGSSSIFSSIVNADSTGTSGVGLFDNGTQVLIRATWKGDANCDGVVNADDMSLLMFGQAQHGTDWESGDFNHDQKINADDVIAFAYTLAYSRGRDFNNVFSAQASIVEATLPSTNSLSQLLS